MMAGSGDFGEEWGSAAAGPVAAERSRRRLHVKTGGGDGGEGSVPAPVLDGTAAAAETAAVP